MVMIRRQKKWGHLRIIFWTSGYRYPEVGNIFRNISAKTKYFSKIFWGIAQGPRYYRFMQKTRHQKSHATVPLKECIRRFFSHKFALIMELNLVHKVNYYIIQDKERRNIESCTFELFRLQK